MQGSDEQAVVQSLAAAYEENPLLALKLLFQLRDVSGFHLSHHASLLS